MSLPSDVIQAPKPEPQIMRYELSDYEWSAIKPMLPNKPRGVRRVNDRRVLCVQVRDGATCQRPMVPAPLVTIASFGGAWLAYGTKSWMRWPPVMMRQYK
jgi:transposase